MATGMLPPKRKGKRVRGRDRQSMETKHIVHVITGLNRGGAERMLLKLLSGMHRQLYRNTVISLMDKGAYGEVLERDLGIPVHSLGLKPGSLNIAVVFRLAGIIRSLKPDLLQGWMYHGDIAASMGRLVSRYGCPVLWNVRGTLSFENERPFSRQLIRLHRHIGRNVAAIIYNSHTAAWQHEQFGFDSSKTTIIPNGFDTDDFRPRPDAHRKLLNTLGVPSTRLVVGLSARFHKMKDFETFFRAAARIAAVRPDVVFALAGTGVIPENQELVEMINAVSLQDSVYLLGERADMEEIVAGFDCLCLSSAWGEGFPNVVGEAMACGVPCAATDVGDCAEIIGGSGRVVPPRDPEALAAAMLELIWMSGEQRAVIGHAARDRIIKNYSLPAIVQQYERLFENVMHEKAVRL